ncbi:hypothetical protein [Ramlibacter sp.]|uniref:hypothetical protein n=1 Tax=Ramlibacter sp. TaxID=1917967 RepID=UPI0026215471|nr:hypothetical protein [Ramlibacter sp.]MDB5958192.1 hypothetical protein [Ramlibacter sp.]
MNQGKTALIALAAGLAFCTGVAGQVLAPSDYQAREQAIATRLSSARKGCAGLAAHPKAVCFAEANAGAKIARANLEASYRPSAKARHRALIVAADSRLAVARVRCADRSGTARRTCETQAMSAWTSADADADARLKTAEAKAKASEQSLEDREDASSETLEARYAAARRQCDGYVGKTRDLCLLQTRAHFSRR